RRVHVVRTPVTNRCGKRRNARTRPGSWPFGRDGTRHGAAFALGGARSERTRRSFYSCEDGMVVQRILDFFRGNPSSPQQIERLVKRLTETGGEDGPRIEAAEKLADLGTREATYALLKRFTISSKVITQDIEEKRMVVDFLVEKGRDAVDPILAFLQAYHQVEWPVQALTRILPQDEWAPQLVEVLQNVAQNPFTSPEHRTSLIKAMQGHVTPEIAETLKKSLEDDDDDVRIAAIQAIAEVGENVRESLLQSFIESSDRPRIRIAVAELFADHDWPVKGYRPTIEQNLPEGFYVTAQVMIRRKVSVARVCSLSRSANGG